MILKTITPVHIGTGVKYGKLEFTVEGNTLHRIDFNRYLQSLTTEEKKRIYNYIKEGEWESVRRGFSREFSVYSAEIKREVDKRSMEEVREAYKTLGGLPYIPGSSVKGSLRSGLFLYYALRPEISKRITGIDVVKRVKDEIRNSRKVNRKWVAARLEREFFFVGSRDYGKKEDAKYDLFRFVHVSDFMPKNAKLYVDQIRTFSYRYGKMMEKYFKIYAETAEGEFEGEIKLDVQGIRRALDSREYPLLREKLALIGITEEDLADVENAQRKFFKSLLERATVSRRKSYLHDMDLLTKLPAAGRTGEFLLENLPDVENRLRIGFGVGTHFQGIIKAIEESDPEFAADLINRFNKVHRRAGKGDSKLEPPYPKTVEVTSEAKLLGWVSFEGVR